MVKLNDLFDLGRLQEEIRDGFVSNRYSEDGRLCILNYSPSCQYARRWNEVTTQCRGLIYDTETHEVLARPFPKFFNYDESGVKYPPPGPVLRMPKMDGSLGILYPIYSEKWNGGEPGRFITDYAIATRGSLQSEQAIWATEFLRNYMDGLAWQSAIQSFVPVEGKTYLFEIIYPENKIVVDYGDEERLVLLDVIDNETGLMDTDEFDNCAWPDKVERELLPGFDSGQVNDIPDGEEGFVYAWPTRNFRTKMKSAEYVEIHRLVFGLTEKRVWEHIFNGTDMEALKAKLPEEFQKFIDDTRQKILMRAMYVEMNARTEYGLIMESRPKTRKDFALKAAKSENSKYLFALHDGKDISKMALLAVKDTLKEELPEDV